MKKLDYESYRKIDFLESREIQGLYSFKACCESFWTLKARVDLAAFNKKKGELTK